MPLKSVIINTIKSEKNTILVYFFNTFLLIFIFNLMLNQYSILYPLIISLFSFSFYFIFKVQELYYYQKKIYETKMGNTDIEAINIYEELCLNVITQAKKDYTESINILDSKLKERNILISQFVHNIKSSVSVINLAIDSNNYSKLSDINSENQKIKIQLEELLNILRFDEFSNDYIPEKINLKEIVNSAINNRKSEFIYSKIFPKVEIESSYVYTDKKWATYIIEQIISNSIKYSNENSKVFFSTENQGNSIILKIQDFGIGISEEELSKVFEPFYTGKNGRSNQNSTGIGLSMVKLVASRLDHPIFLESKIDKGTTFCISFKIVR